MRIILGLALTVGALIAQPQPESEMDGHRTQPRTLMPQQQQPEYVQSGAGVVAVNPDQPYRPIPVARSAAPRQNFFEFLIRAANPRQIDWGAEIDRRIQNLLEHSIDNPYFRLCTIQLGLIIFLLTLCYFWYDNTEKTKQLAADGLADTLNAKLFADRKAQEAIRRYNEHIEKCNRAIEAQESGIPIGHGQSNWQEEMRNLQQKYVEEHARAERLAEAVKEREEVQTRLDKRLQELELETQRRASQDPNSELVARLQRAEAQLSAKRSPKNGS